MEYASIENFRWGAIFDSINSVIRDKQKDIRPTIAYYFDSAKSDFKKIAGVLESYVSGASFRSPFRNLPPGVNFLDLPRLSGLYEDSFPKTKEELSEVREIYMRAAKFLDLLRSDPERFYLDESASAELLGISERFSRHYSEKIDQALRTEEKDD